MRSRKVRFSAALKAAIEADRTPRGTYWKHDAWGLCECGRKKRHHGPDGLCPPSGGRAAGMLADAAPDIVSVLEEAEKQSGIGTIRLQDALARLDAKVPQ